MRDIFAYCISIIEIISGRVLDTLNENAGDEKNCGTIRKAIESLKQAYDISFIEKLDLILNKQINTNIDVWEIIRDIFISNPVYILSKNSTQDEKSRMSEKMRKYVGHFIDLDISRMIQQNQFEGAINMLLLYPTVIHSSELIQVKNEYRDLSKFQQRFDVEIQNRANHEHKAILAFQKMVLFGYDSNVFKHALIYFKNNRDKEDIKYIADLLYTEKEYETAFSFYQYITQMPSGGEDYNSHVNLLNCLLQIKDKFFVLDHVKDVISYLIKYTNDERITYLVEVLKQSGKTHLVIQPFRTLSIVIHGHNFQTYISQLEQIC